MFRLRGLGASPYLNPAMQATFDPNLVHGGAGAESEYAGTFVIKQHTWTQVWSEIFPNTYPNEDVSAHEYNLSQLRERVRAAGSGIAPCPTESITDNGTSCYYGRFTPITGPGYDGTGYSASGPYANEIGLLAPGTFAVYGVAFAAGDLQDGRFAKSIRPAGVQRRALEWAVLRASKQLLDGKPGYHWRVLGDGLIRGSIKTYVRKQTTATFVSDAMASQIFQNASVDAMLLMVPDITLFLANFERNPVQPTPAERTEQGGWMKWMSRGGFPISKAVASGQHPVSDAIGLQFCASYLCACPSTGVNTGAPSCVPATFTKSGVNVGGTERAGNFHPYVTVNQDMKDPWFGLTLVYDDPAWITKIGEAGAALMKKLADITCMAIPAAKAQMESIRSEKCVDKNGAPCKKGTVGCVCSTPPAGSRASVVAFEVWAQHWCNGWAQQNQPDPMQNLPPPPPPPLAPPATSKVPWWLVIGGGVVVGAALFARK